MLEDNNTFIDEYYYGHDDHTGGDATGEMGPFYYITFYVNQISSWHNDEVWFVESVHPWFVRGANFPHGLVAGVFTFLNSYESVYANVSFRIVLAF